jgi:SpoVK/Ycf46/Vps4 family AAA+-type ATPase
MVPGFLATRDHAASSPLILLHGRPGTGKTTLCRALAQKISIRMSTEYPVAKLIELHSAQLMSKFFSESGRQVQDVFETIYRLCKKHDNTFFCIFIDEVDTIARSREVAAANNEVTDSQRVTGEILKGIDNLKEFFNFVMVATTNLHEHLDEAFLSRCAYIHAMEEPGQAAQYEILAGQLRSYMNNKIVVPRVLIPTYQTAVASVSQTQTESAGSKLLKLLDVIQALSNDTRLGWENSGRTLCNLVSTAFKIYGRPRPATVDEVFSYIHRYLEIQRKRHRETSVQHQNDDDDESEHTIEYRCKKTKHRITINWDGTFNEAAFRRSKAEAESAVFGMSRDTAIRIEEDVKQGKMTLKESVTQLYRDNKRNAEREASEARVEHAQKATDSENQGPEAETESTANNEQQHTVKAHADGLEKENDFMHVAAEDVEEDDNVLLLD